MAVDCIVCECRWLCILLSDLSIWYKSKLDKCLKTVTDTKCKSISLINELFNSLCHLCISKCCCKEFSWSLRLISCWESTREHDNLRFVNCLYKLINRIADILCCEILEYLDYCVSACSFKCLSTIILTVCSREYRNKYCRLSHFILAYIDILCIVKTAIYLACIVCCLCMENALKLCCPYLDSLLNRKHHIVTLDSLLIVYIADYRGCIWNTCCINYLSDLWKCINRNLSYDITKARCKECIACHLILDGYTKLVTKCHLWYCCCEAFSVKCICWNNCAILDKISDCCIKCHNLIIFWKIKLILIYCK